MPLLRPGPLTLLGGVLIHLTLGTIYCWGNSTPYITSYLRNENDQDVTSHDTLAVYSSALLGQGFFMYVGGVMEGVFGAKKTCAFAIFVVSVSTFMSGFATNLMVLMAWQFLFGIGIGLGYVAPMKAGYKHYPDSAGFVSGVVVAGFGGGSFVFNFVVSQYVNPDNLSPDDDVDYYSVESGVPGRVPGMYRLLGFCFAILGGLGVYCLRDDVEADHEGEEKTPLLVLSEDRPERGEALSSSPSPSPTPVMRKDSESSGSVNISSAYLLGFAFICCGSGGLYLAGSYKSYGEDQLPDSKDSFFAASGSISSIFNGAGRILWGLLADRIGVFDAMALMSLLFPSFLLIYCKFSTSEVVFRATLWALFLCYGGNFSLFPTATKDLFGAKYVGQNYGAMFLLFGTLSAVIIYGMGVSQLEYATCNYAILAIASLGFFNVILLLFKERGGFLTEIKARRPKRQSSRSESDRNSQAQNRRTQQELQNLSGTYVLRRNENYSDFLRAQGVGWATRSAANAAPMTVRLIHAVENKTFTIAVDGFLKSETDYEIGGGGKETFISKTAFIDHVTEEYLPGGRVKIVTTKECKDLGSTIIVERYYEDEFGLHLVVKQTYISNGGTDRVVAWQFFEKKMNPDN